MPHFEVRPHDRSDKRIEVRGPDDLRMEVDFDDVDHDAVERQVAAIVRILNARWKREGSTQWCPVCHTFHTNPGIRTDAGIIERDCGRA